MLETLSHAIEDQKSEIARLVNEQMNLENTWERTEKIEAHIMQISFLQFVYKEVAANSDNQIEAALKALAEIQLLVVGEYVSPVTYNRYGIQEANSKGIAVSRNAACFIEGALRNLNGFLNPSP